MENMIPHLVRTDEFCPHRTEDLVLAILDERQLSGVEDDANLMNGN